MTEFLTTHFDKFPQILQWIILILATFAGLIFAFRKAFAGIKWEPRHSAKLKRLELALGAMSDKESPEYKALLQVKEAHLFEMGSRSYLRGEKKDYLVTLLSNPRIPIKDGRLVKAMECLDVNGDIATLRTALDVQFERFIAQLGFWTISALIFLTFVMGLLISSVADFLAWIFSLVVGVSLQGMFGLMSLPYTTAKKILEFEKAEKAIAAESDEDSVNSNSGLAVTGNAEVVEGSQV